MLYGSVVNFVPGSVSSSPHNSLGMRLLTCTQIAFINQEMIFTIMHLHTRTEELEGVCGMHPHLFNKLLAIIKHGSFSDIGLNILFAPALNPLVYSMTGEHVCDEYVLLAMCSYTSTESMLR